MNEFEIRNLIRESAEDIEVPESLKPQQIKSKLKKKKKDRRSFYAGYAASAAVLLAVCSFALFRGMGNDKADDSVVYQQEAMVENKVSSVQKEASEETGIPTEEQEWQDQLQLAALPKSDAGDIYKIASDYGQVYDSVMQVARHWKYSAISDLAGSIVVEEAIEKEYSTTNLQTEGVDESDIIKTDGSYLYVVSNNKIHILDIQNGEPKETAVISLPSNSASLNVREIYVDSGLLIAVSQEKSTELKELTESKEYYTDTREQTYVYTYSLKKPSEPELLGQVSQDGYYHTSRKIDDKVYLFTRNNIGENCYGQSRDSEGWIPLVGEEPIASDCIYIPEQGTSSLIISSVDTGHPDQVLDHVMIVNNSANVYVSTQAVYLYHTDYGQNVTTQIAKFSIKDGIIDAVSAVSVNGQVTDTFALNEKQGMLRILTNAYDDRGSSLYILDEKLSVLGVLEGIAPGEDVYAARYLGDMAYFVTYRNVDPLFAADLSDPANPVILGELKITGYSEYLHMWKDDTMLGIGYETDPDSGSREGVKLSMFDVSDPVNLQVTDCICIANADYSPAMDQFKTVLADPKANLIGFVVTDYNMGQSNTFLLFEYKEGTFHNLLTEEISDSAENYRSLYCGEYFYIVSPKEVMTFKMSDDFEKVGELVINEV